MAMGRNSQMVLENKKVINILEQLVSPNLSVRSSKIFLSSSEIYTYQENFTALIAFLLISNIEEFMKRKGFSEFAIFNAGEEDYGEPQTAIWNLENNYKEFVQGGTYIFWSHSVRSPKNILVSIFFDERHNTFVVSFCTTNHELSVQYLSELKEYTKKKNVLKNTCIRNLSLHSGNFDILSIPKNCSFENFYYETEINNLIDTEIVDFVKNIKEYAEVGIRKRGVLFFGSAGTGKTSLSKIICNKVKDHASVLWLTPDVLIQNGHNTSHSLGNIYSVVEYLLPCVVIYEDIDLLTQDRNHSIGTSSLGTLMNFLDGVNTISETVTIATTNRLDLIESAIRNRPGRFDRVVEVPPLNQELRKQMITKQLSGWKNSKSMVEYIIGKTNGRKEEGWTGAEIQELVNTINIHHISRKKKCKTLSKEIIDEALESMQHFGIEAANNGSHSFGFGKIKSD